MCDSVALMHFEPSHKTAFLRILRDASFMTGPVLLTHCVRDSIMAYA